MEVDFTKMEHSSYAGLPSFFGLGLDFMMVSCSNSLVSCSASGVGPVGHARRQSQSQGAQCRVAETVVQCQSPEKRSTILDQSWIILCFHGSKLLGGYRGATSIWEPWEQAFGTN